MRLLLLIIILFLVIFIHFVEGARKKPGRKDQARCKAAGGGTIDVDYLPNFFFSDRKAIGK
jgi:hypothetical protein